MCMCRKMSTATACPHARVVLDDAARLGDVRLVIRYALAANAPTGKALGVCGHARWVRPARHVCADLPCARLASSRCHGARPAWRPRHAWWRACSVRTWAVLAARATCTVTCATAGICLVRQCAVCTRSAQGR
jgi:hypothetical protein